MFVGIEQSCLRRKWEECGMRAWCCWLPALVSGVCWGGAAAASSVTPVRGLVGNWSSDRELLLRSPWAARLGWNRTLPMCGDGQKWNQSAVDAGGYEDFIKACYCSRTDMFPM